MATLQVYATDVGGVAHSTASVYQDILDGNGSLNYSSSTYSYYIGQRFFNSSYKISYGYLEFDTSSIPAGASISSASIQVYQEFGGFDTNYTLQLRPYDWSPTVGTEDFILPSNYATLPLASSFFFDKNNWGYQTFSSSANFISSITPNGITRFVLGSDRVASQTTPVDTEDGGIRGPSYGTVADRPILTVEYTGGASGFTHLDMDSSGLRQVAAGSGHYLVQDGSGYRRIAGTEGSGALILGANGNIIKKA